MATGKTDGGTETGLKGIAKKIVDLVTGLFSLKTFTLKKFFTVLILFSSLFILIVFGGSIFETNDAGFYQVKQAWLSGNLSVRSIPGTYWQGLGKITTYQYAAALDFTGGKQGQGSEGGLPDSDLGGHAVVDTPFAVTFQGNSTANVSGIIKFRMPVDEAKQLSLHNTYRGEASVIDTLVRQSVGEAVKLAGPMFTAEEARTTKREEFTTLILDMLEHGIYQTYSTVETSTDEDHVQRTVAVTRLKLDKDGKPQIAKTSALKDFGITVIQFAIRGLDFDKVTQDLMMAKKQAEQEKIVARANAEKAKQDALTAIEQGKATVAKAQAEENEKKIRQVVKAQADFESAQFQRKQAEEVAKAKLVEGEAEARVANLKVRAGLSPLEKATIGKETAIGIAEALAKTQFPASMIVVGGAGSAAGGKVDPFTALGLSSMYDMTKRMERENVRKEKATDDSK